MSDAEMQLTFEESEAARNLAVSGGEVDDPLVQRLFAHLADCLRRRERTADDIGELLSRQLESRVDPTTWPSIENSLTLLLDDQPAAHTLSWILQDSSGERVARVSDGENGAATFVRRLRAVFGRDIDLAVAQMNLGARDWLGIDRALFVNQDTGIMWTRLMIRRSDGETFELEGSATSMLALAQVLLDAILAVGSPEAFSAGDRETFIARLKEVRALLSPEEPQAAASNGDDRLPPPEIL